MKTKKTTVWILPLALLLCAFALFSCAKEPDSGDGAHVLVHHEAKPAESCTEDGHIEYWYCSDCGKYYADGEGKHEIAFSDTVIPAGHVPVHHDGKAASCTEAGWEAYDTCERCDYTTYRPIGKTGHRYENGECVFCHAPKPDEDFEYSLSSDGTYYILSSVGNVTDRVLCLPEVHDGKPVREIGSWAFKDATVTDVMIPEGYHSIGLGAFSGCSGLVSISIPESMTTINGSAFPGCSKLLEVINHSALDIRAGSEENGLIAYYAKTVHQGDSRIVNTGDYRFFTDADGVHYLVGYTGYDTTLTLPDTYDGQNYLLYPYAFCYLSDLTSVTIPYGFTNISEGTFACCTGLREIVIPESVTTLGMGALAGCTALTEITLPSGVTSLSGYVLAGCTGIVDITIPENITTIGEAAFYGCTGLVNVTIPENVTTIGGAAFYGCRGLVSVTIGRGVTSIESGAFYGCSKLLEVINLSSLEISAGSHDNGSVAYYAMTVHTGESRITRVGDYLFFTDDDGRNNLIGYTENDTALTLPDTCNGQAYRIYENAFDGRKELVSVVIPEGVTSIGDYAFSGCTGLTSITIPESLASIGSSAFGYDPEEEPAPLRVCIAGLTAWCGISFANGESNPLCHAGSLYLNGKPVADLVFPDGVTSVGNYAFYGCTGLVRVTIGHGITDIGTYAFRGCKNLESVAISDTVGHIGYCAFRECESLSAVYITDLAAWCGISFEQDEANPLCSAEDLYLNGRRVTDLVIPDGVTSISEYAFSDGKCITGITIPDTVTEIGSFAFYRCENLKTVRITDLAGWCRISFDGSGNNPLSYGADLYVDGELVTDLVIPLGVTRIGDYAFWGCTSIRSITFSDSVSRIGNGAFAECTGLTDIVIPDRVKEIGTHVFSDCIGLKSVKIGSGVTSIGGYAFGGCTGLKSVTIGNGVMYIDNDAFWGCTGLTSITVAVGNSFYHSDGNCLIDTASKILIFGCRNSVIPTDGSVTRIGQKAFSGCTGLTSITIPEGVTSIGYEAFRDCTGLTSITIPDSVMSIGYEAFRDCTGLTSITIPDSVTSIGGGAFDGCTGLTSITIPDSVTSIGEEAFSGCTGLMSVTIGSGVTSIDSSVFEGCTGLTSVTIGSGVTSIGDGAFRGCTGLVSITIPDGVTKIDWRAFEGCTGLTSITIGSGVTSIGLNAFFGCTVLTSITYKGTMAEWESIRKEFCWNENTGAYVIRCTDGDISK